jgi:hypothetical protein
LVLELLGLVVTGAGEVVGETAFVELLKLAEDVGVAIG